METFIGNAIARLQSAPPAPVAKPDLSGAEDITYLHARLVERERQYGALLELHERMKKDMTDQVSAARAECDAMRSQRDVAERMCAEYKGRSEAVVTPVAAPVAAPDATNKYEALVAEFTDLRVLHGSCAAREKGLQDVIAELRRVNETMQAQIQAALTEDDEPEEEGSETESGCEIDVIRGGDDRIRTLKVRYT